MRFFFRSRQFKIIAATAVLLLVISAVCALLGNRMAPQADIAGTLTAPFRSAASKITSAVTDFFRAYSRGERLALENAELENEAAELKKKLAEYEQAVAENEFYKEYLEIKDDNPDFEFTPATVISRDREDPYMGFVINRGSVNGIAAHDPVITEDGLVGYIGEVGLTSARVVTILSAELTAGALDNRTNDSGIVSGTVELAEKGQTRFSNLSRSSGIAVGDYAVTSGEGVFPAGLLIGTIQSIGSDKYNTSIYAEVLPFADIESLKRVMVITAFDGQGDIG